MVVGAIVVAVVEEVVSEDEVEVVTEVEEGLVREVCQHLELHHATSYSVIHLLTRDTTGGRGAPRGGSRGGPPGRGGRGAPRGVGRGGKPGVRGGAKVVIVCASNQTVQTITS